MVLLMGICLMRNISFCLENAQFFCFNVPFLLFKIYCTPASEILHFNNILRYLNAFKTLKKEKQTCETKMCFTISIYKQNQKYIFIKTKIIYENIHKTFNYFHNKQ